MLYMLSKEEFEKLFLDRWYSTKQKNNESHNNAIKNDQALQVHRGAQIQIHNETHKDSMKMHKANTTSLYSYGNCILQVHGLLQEENVIILINPS